MKLTQYGKWTTILQRNTASILPGGIIIDWIPGHVEKSDQDKYDGGELWDNGRMIDKWGCSNRVVIPEFPISPNPVFKIRAIAERRFNVIERYNFINKKV